ncbi:Mu transposase C-terminal domain-containing protein [Desulfohalovibrio reitneri]|uniref:Mu transposase C-terminal domain-containing protein n=1 Tax=Desulfohalovibrio reitneri TaxID=1307759 RepID=UPI001F38343F|nr:Mu transposase C-terminal domain-containing protein [Desulfohalovibrio reitneri]
MQKLKLHEAKESTAENASGTSVQLDDRRKRVAAARLDLVNLYLDWLAKQGKGVEQRESFIRAYQVGMWPQLLETIGPKVSWKTLERWKKSAERGGLAAVADKRGLTRKGSRRLTEHQKQMLIRFWLQPGQPSIASAYREANKALAFEGGELIQSERTARRFLLEDFYPYHYGDSVYTREGAKAWNDRCAFFIERDYSLIEVGDILVADGHKLNFEIINPTTGKPQRMEMVLWYDMRSNFPMGWEIMPSENTQCIAAAFRRACLLLGKFPKVAYLDNGRAFRSKYFNDIDLRETGLGGLFAELGVQTLFAWPYHGQSKTVERFFGTFAELERWAPSYTGTSIATKPARMLRGEKVHRDIYEKSGARPLTLIEAHQAIAMFFDEYIARPQKGHLAGQSPLEVFQDGRGPGLGDADLVKLRDLMLTKTVRSVQRNGVSLFGRTYYAPELYNRRHPVTVKYDPQDLDADGEVARVLVYDTDGRPICCAEKTRKYHPAARILGNEQDVADLTQAIEFRKGQERQASRYCRTLLERVVIPETQRRMELVAEHGQERPTAQPENTEPTQAEVLAIEDAQAKASARRSSRPAYTPPEQVREITDELSKYEYLFNIRHRDGIELRESDAQFMEQFEASPDYPEARYSKLLRVFNHWNSASAAS